MKKICLFLQIFAFVSFYATAETATIAGGTVTYTGATATTVGDDLVLTFSDSEVVGTISFSNNAQARVLAVGGGGAGGSIGPHELDQRGMDLTGAAGGGGAGGFSDRKIVLTEGCYTVTVGKGGRTAQTVAASWVGGEGGKSELKRGDDIVFSVVGGGGGGASKIGGNGMAGGSGGGGSWYGAALAAGSGVEGFGYAGGTPTAAGIGGGGGGAGGRGGADGTAGAVHASDITGASVDYAPGGRGGRFNDDNYTPATVSKPGAGGDGAAAGAGAAGADGIVVVRISRLFAYQYVDEPVYVKSAYFTNNTTYVAFDLSQQSQAFRDAVLSVSGETGTTTAISDGGAYTNGYGRHSFTIKLKEGYLWRINGSTSDSDYTGYWRIVDEGTIGLASVDIQKSVTWTDGSKAKIDILAHLVPETKKGTPEVLFLSGRCAHHGYSPTIAKAALDAITEVGNVDYYFFDRVRAVADAAPAQYGRLTKGQTFNASILGTMSNGNHSLMYGFYNTLWEDVVSQNKQYDYIVFSFDRSRACTEFPAVHAHEADVAAYLLPFYKNHAVIWLVDHDPYQCDPLDITQTPWFPSQLVYSTSGDTDKYGWTSLESYNHSGSVAARADNYVSGELELNAMMGLFCPSKYPVTNYREVPATAGWTGYPRIAAGDETAWRNALLSAGDAIEYQELYDNAERVADMIKKAVVPKSFNAVVNDKVCVTMGLDVKAASGFWTTNEDLVGWATLTQPDQLQITSTGVNVNLTNLWDEAWIKFTIDVEDNGTFLNNQNATYNERTGKWEKDPNDGPVRIEMRPDGESAIIAEAEAKTSVNWTFEAYTVTATVRTGPETGTTIINGYYVPSLTVSEGYSPEVVFNGAPGYVLNYLEIDGVEITDYAPTISSWIFPRIQANHSVVVGYEKVDMKLIRAKQRYPWNNLIDIDYFIGGADLGKTGAMYGRLIFYVEYEDPADSTQRIKKQLRTFRDNTKLFFNGPSADAANFSWPESGFVIDLDEHPELRTPGFHRVTWDSNADGVAVFQKKKVNFTMNAVRNAIK